MGTAVDPHPHPRLVSLLLARLARGALEPFRARDAPDRSLWWYDRGHTHTHTHTHTQRACTAVYSWYSWAPRVLELCTLRLDRAWGRELRTKGAEEEAGCQRCHQPEREVRHGEGVWDPGACSARSSGVVASSSSRPARPPRGLLDVVRILWGADPMRCTNGRPHRCRPPPPRPSPLQTQRHSTGGAAPVLMHEPQGLTRRCVETVPPPGLSNAQHPGWPKAAVLIRAPSRTPVPALCGLGRTPNAGSLTCRDGGGGIAVRRAASAGRARPRPERTAGAAGTTRMRSHTRRPRRASPVARP